MRKKMSDTRRKALRSARGVIRRLEKSNLSVKDIVNLEDLYSNLSTLNTQRLKTITRKNLVYWAQDIEAGKPKEFLKEKTPENTGILKMSDAELQVANIIKVLEEGSDFVAIRMGNIGAQSAIQSSANRIRNIFEQARDKFTDEEVIEKIKEKFGTVKHFEDWLEEMIYIIYNQYEMGAADDPGYYDREISKLVELFGVMDPGFIA